MVVKLAFTVQEVSEMTNFGRTFLYQQINSGTLAAKKCGRRTTILQQDLEAFLENLESYPVKNGGLKNV